MNPMNAAVLTAVIAMLGRWSKNKKTDIRFVIQMSVIALGLALTNEMNEELARKFALLIVVVAAFTYAQPIAIKAGLLKK
jgi:hypothetical protein